MGPILFFWSTAQQLKPFSSHKNLFDYSETAISLNNFLTIMKFINSSVLLAALPAATGSLLRGSSRNFETAVVGGAHRNLDEECVGPATYGGESDIATCCMPEEIDHAFFTHGEEIKARTTHAGNGDDLETSYWHITFDDDPTDGGRLHGVQMNGWCVDLSRFMGNTEYMFDVFSTYDDFPYDNVLDSPEKLGNVNWMINNFRLGESYEVSNDFLIANQGTDASPGACYGQPSAPIELKWQTMQNAVWRTVDKGALNGQYYEQSGSNTCLVWYMVDQNGLYGDHYEPSCDDPDAKMAIILIHDVDGGDNTINKQVIIGEARLHTIEGACVPVECCEELSIHHETFQENTELDVIFSSGGADSDSAWEVSFLGDSGVYNLSLGPVNVWSVDLDRDSITEGTTLWVDAYSTYDNWYRFNVVDKKENVPKVNYLINTWPVGSTGATGCGDSVSVLDFQDAVWKLMDDADLTLKGSESCVNFLVTDADSNGADYEPSCADGTTDKLAVLLIVDALGAYKKKYTGRMSTNDVIQLETVTGQVVIAEIPLGSITDACYTKDCECCDPVEFDFPVGAPSDTRDDPTGGSPVEEIFTPAPAPVRVPSEAECLDPIEIKGSNFGARCGHQGVTVIGTGAGEGGATPALRIDILDTLFGITTGTTDTKVEFRVQNPFDGVAVDMYIQYETGDGSRYITCDAENSVDECQFFGGDAGSFFTADCIDPRSHDPSKIPYALVTAFFVESGDDLFDFTTTNNVPECCQPDATNTGTVVSYTFEVMCTCPGGTDAEFRQ
jgi:hypothetical protein